jgi:hypothetical protein
MVITAYATANAIVTSMTSWLSQQFGRRNYWLFQHQYLHSPYVEMLQIYGS